MLKKLLPILLALLLCAAAAEEPATLVITADMEFYSGPGTHYLQSAFHNTPPQPGETAQVLGRVRGTDGQDWLFVRFTGHWFDSAYPVQYYLPLASAPEWADAPLVDFMQESNALAAESVRVYADPEGTNYDGYLTPDDAGVTVLDVQGGMACIEAVNPFGVLRRGYVSIRDLAVQPGFSALPAAPEETAVLSASHVLPLTHRPHDSQCETLLLADGSLVMRYGTIPADAPWGEALAIIDRSGQLRANAVYRTHDGTEVSTIEFLLGSPLGFKVCRFTGEDMSPVHEIHFSPDGQAQRTDVRRYSQSDPRPCMGTAGFTVFMGRTIHAEETGSATIPLRIAAASGEFTQLSVDRHATLLGVHSCGDGLLVALADGADLRFLLLNGSAALTADIRQPARLPVTDLQCLPMADGRIALLLGDGRAERQVCYLDAAAGTLTPGLTLQIPENRRVALLAADGEQLLLAVSGVETQLILVTGQEQQLAGSTPGAILHAHVGGTTASLLLLHKDEVRLENWTIILP